MLLQNWTTPFHTWKIGWFEGVGSISHSVAYIWSNSSDRKHDRATKWSWLSKESPFISVRFRLVKDYNAARYIQLIMVKCWIGLVVWIHGIPLWKGLLLKGTLIRIPNHRAPNHQTKPLAGGFPGQDSVQVAYFFWLQCWWKCFKSSWCELGRERKISEKSLTLPETNTTCEQAILKMMFLF